MDLQAAFIDRLRSQVAALNTEFADHREAAADTTTRLFKIVEEFGNEARELHLAEMQRQLHKLYRSELDNWTSSDPPDPVVVLDEYFAAALKRIEAMSRRQAMHRGGASLRGLQQEFYGKTEAELNRIQALLTTAGRGVPSDKELDRFRETVDNLIWEADSLEIPAPLRLRLFNLSTGALPLELTAALRFVKIFSELNAREESGPRSADK